MSARRPEALGSRRHQARIETPARRGHQGRYGWRNASVSLSPWCCWHLANAISIDYLSEIFYEGVFDKLGGLAYIPDRKSRTKDTFSAFP